MISFNNDYSELCHPEILKRMEELGDQQHPGYGMDTYTEQAKMAIRNQLYAEQADIHFVVGGTQANLVCLAAFLKPFEAIIACNTGHINVHETGAIEATGHKICLAQEKHGKVTVEEVERIVLEHGDEHMVKPRLVFLSNSTELGTIYYKEELISLRKICDKYGLLLYLDGARLGSAMAASDNDISWKELAHYLDAFYIGGTKNGALFGEAIVLLNPALKKDFRFHIKQRGALLAKGYALGLQFSVLFQNDLLTKIARHANAQADKIRESLKQKQIPCLYPTSTNQIFPILTRKQVEALQKNIQFSIWENREESVVIRLVTSWATKEEATNIVCREIEHL